jgi:hypothetical protein
MTPSLWEQGAATTVVEAGYSGSEEDAAWTGRRQG